jgi:hypothetical protein
MQNLRRGINRILLLMLSTGVLSATEGGYLATIDGVSSFGENYLPGTVVSPYSADSINYGFTDYGGRFLRMADDWGLGLSSHLYSAFGGRVAGNYRLALGWVPLQLRARKTWLNGILFTELGTGPAYGFGAVEYLVTPASGGTAETRYHRYNEWGWMSSAVVGADIKLHSGLSLQIFTEGAWIFAKIRNPKLTESDSINASQLFLRPGLAIALRF